MPLFPLPSSRYPLQFLLHIISCFLPSPMAASSNLHHHKNNSSATFDPAISLPIPNTTFVQANPSNFRAVVQKLTGAPPPLPPQDSLSVPKPTRLAGKSNSGEMGPRRPVFKLHERRLQTAARKLEIKLNDNGGGLSPVEYSPSSSSSSAGGCYGNKLRNFSTGFGGEMVMVSPVSPLELLGRGSPRTPPCKSSSSSSPMAMEDEEMKGIAEKGFYLHPSPLSTPRGGGGGAAEPPELLPLFPLHSPTTDHRTSS